MWIGKKALDSLNNDLDNTFNRYIELMKENSNLRNRITELLKVIYDIKQMSNFNDYGRPEQRLQKIKELIKEFEGND